MDFSALLSHASTIRAIADEIEKIAAVFIPGAAPVVAMVNTVETAVFGAADALTSNNPALAVTRSAPDVNGVRAVSVDGSWAVTDLTAAADVLHTGSYANCEAWAEANCAAGFSIQPYSS